MKAFLLSFLLVSLVLQTPKALAQAAPQIQVQVDDDTVGAGEVVRVEMSATSGDAMPTDPQLGSTPGFAVRGQSASPTQTHLNINGNRSDRYTLTVAWSLQAQRVGMFAVGPPSVVVGGVRYAGRTLTLRVVPAGQAPPRRAQPPPVQSPFSFSPFDPWKGLLQPPDFDDQKPAAPQAVTTDPKLSLDAARGAVYFLHATVDKAAAAVGEQVTFSVYEYIDAGATNLEVDDEDVHDAQAADFVKHPLLREDQEAQLAGYANVGGHVWVVKLVRRWALFPLHAGDLTIGPMSVSLLRPRTAGGAKRTTETLRVRVTEPPLAGRPPGYALGDVGRFALTAQVSPREVEQGGAIAVHVELSGRGNVPSAVAAPVREGVEWLAPELHEQLGATGHDAFGGKRTFDFVVRLHRSGAVDLGEIGLPYWDPDQRRYDVARVPLGTVRVAAAATPAGSSEQAAEQLPGLPPARDTLEGLRPARSHADDSPLFWILGVGLWPSALGAAVVGRAAGVRVSRTLRSRRVSSAAELRGRVAAARAACEGGDGRTADAAIARALEAAAVAYAGVSVRDAVGDEVVERLAGAGVGRDAAFSVAELLRECSAARFAPDAADVVAARDRWNRAQRAMREIERRG